MHNWQIHFIILAFVLCFFLPIGFNLINRCLCAVGWTWKLFVCDIWFNRQDSLSIYFLFYLTFFCKVHGVFHLKKKKHDAHVTYAPDCKEIIINFICYNYALYLQLFFKVLLTLPCHLIRIPRNVICKILKV